MQLEPSTYSGQLSTTAQVTAFPGFLWGIDLLPPATGNASVIIYDSAVGVSSTQTVVCQLQVTTSLASSITQFAVPRAIQHGLYAVLTGTTSYVINYSRSF